MADKAEKNSPVGVAKENLRNGFASPAAKIGIAVGVVAVIGMGATAMSLMRSRSEMVAAAEAQNYAVAAKEPRGEVDAKTAQALEKTIDEKAEEGREVGKSYAGPYAYASNDKDKAAGGGSQTVDGIDEAGAAKAVELAAPVLAALRAKSREYDAVEVGGQGSGRGAAQGASSGARGQGAGGANGGAQTYGLSQGDFQQVSGQLERVGIPTVTFASLPGGALSKPPVEKKTEVSGSAASGASPAVKTASGSTSDKETVVVRAGDVCAAKPEMAINTDYTVPVFFELIDCGELTGARAKGTVQKGPDDFVIAFTQFTLTPKSKFKLVGNVEGVSASVGKDGSPGVADDVDRHWGTRLLSSGLLAMARTERTFIAARGSQTVNNGTSTSVSIDPLTAEEKRTARVAALLEGGTEVVSKDLNYGVNRAATMTMKADTVIGIQFMADVKVVPRVE